MSSEFDMTAMYAAHDALRRDLEHLARTTAIQALLTEPQWLNFGQAGARMIGPDVARILPWMLDGASDEAVATMLAPLPEPVRLAYVNEWQPAYAATELWGGGERR